MEVLSHDVVERILERVPVESLVRLRSVSKTWKSTIESNNFQKRHLVHRQQSPDRDIIFVTSPIYGSDEEYDDNEYIPSSSPLSFCVDDNDVDDDHIKIISSPPITTLKFPIRYWFHCSASCDGMLCFYDGDMSITVINPTTRWHPTLPPSNFQEKRMSQSARNMLGFATLGFGKDKFSGAYKSVWLYNNTKESEGMAYVTTCEVFDFSINAWRYVTLESPYKIITYIKTVNIDGSLYWLTKPELGLIEVLSFDLHTETFQVVAEAPFDKTETHHYKMCNLNNRLCVSEVIRPNQVMWLFDSGSKTWNHILSIDLEMTYSWFRKSHEIKWNSGNCIGALQPLAILEEKNMKTKVLFSFYIHNKKSYLVIYDGQTESFDLAFTFNSIGWCPKERKNYYGYPVCYFQSLISTL